MGMSETILAAMIGAAATIMTALFQLFSLVKSRGRVEIKPRRTTARSWTAILALMMASAVGGYLYSELLKQHALDDLHAMRQELHDALAESAARVGQASNPVQAAAAASGEPSQTHVIAQHEATPVDSFVYVPACHAQGEAACDEASAPSVTMCAVLPANAKAEDIAVYAQPDGVSQPWEQHRVAFDHDLGGAKFSNATVDLGGVSPICVSFAHWSTEHAFVARLHVDAQPSLPVPAAATTVIAADSSGALPHTASLTSPVN
jgi:hypothetical protein